MEEFESDTDDEDDIIADRRRRSKEEQELGDGEENNDENEGEAIYFEEEREDVRPSTVFLAIELCWKSLCPPNKEEEIVGKWFACIYDSKKVRTYILAEHVEHS